VSHQNTSSEINELLNSIRDLKDAVLKQSEQIEKQSKQIATLIRLEDKRKENIDDVSERVYLGTKDNYNPIEPLTSDYMDDIPSFLGGKK
jgi:uncharacterized coiled-coil protein SlyX